MRNKRFHLALAFCYMPLCFGYLSMPSERTQHVSRNLIATIYNAEPEQCNEDYLHTADMSKIDLAKVNDLRWIALSRDLLKRWGGPFDYGDTVLILHDDKTITGKWVVRDCMNPRWQNRIDFLQCKASGFFGKWEDVTMVRL